MSRGNRALKRLRIIAVGALLTGLFIASIRANFREPPLVRIGEIKPTMSFSTVRVRGILEADARQLRGGSVFYRVNDGSGRLPVFLAQSSSKKLPLAGSRITVEGSLGLGVGHALRLNAQSTDQISVMPEEYISDVKLSEITLAQEGERITAYGRVTQVWHPKGDSKAPHRIILSDPSGSLEIVHWFEPSWAVNVGDRLEVRGTVVRYKERLQLKVWQAKDIRPYLDG